MDEIDCGPTAAPRERAAASFGGDSIMAKNTMAELLDYGQSLWLDNIRRADLSSGRQQQLIDMGLRGQTSNPTIFQKAIAAGADYDEQIRSLLDHAPNPQRLFEELAFRDIQHACDLFRPLYDRSGGR